MDHAKTWRQLATMADMQERHNQLVHLQWRHQGHDYYRAVWVECAELLDHFGWKWWKKQDADLDQVKLEIVDIWHFGLSELLRADGVDEDLALRLIVALEHAQSVDFRRAVEHLALTSLAGRRFDLGAFAAVMRALPLDFAELYRLYVAKNVLNAFRQNHGYKEGTYRKQWHDGREDNAHLVDIVAALDTDAETFPDDLAAALDRRYAATKM